MNIPILILGVLALGVYLDAVRHHIGKTPGKGGLFNMHAGGWAFATFGIFILGLPGYLLSRGRLIAEAKERPVHLTQQRKITSIVLIVVVTLGISVFLKPRPVMIQIQPSGTQYQPY